MNLNQLEYFVASCEEHSITAAARRVPISQQTISSAIAALEAELGSKLLVRTPKGVYPTEAGELVLSHARTVLGDVAALRASVAGLRAGLTSTVRFSFMPEVFLSRSDDFFDRIVADFAEYWPNIELAPLACQTDACVEAVIDGSYELGFVSQEPPTSLVESRVVFECTMDLFVPRDHPLATRRVASFADLVNEELPPPPNMSYPIFDIVKRCQSYGFSPNFVYPSQEGNPSYFDAIVNSGRVGFVPRGHVMVRERDDYVLIPFIDRDVIRLQVRVITRKGRQLSPAAQAFVEFVAIRLQETLE